MCPGPLWCDTNLVVPYCTGGPYLLVVFCVMWGPHVMRWSNRKLTCVQPLMRWFHAVLPCVYVPYTCCWCGPMKINHMALVAWHGLVAAYHVACWWDPLVRSAQWWGPTQLRWTNRRVSRGTSWLSWPNREPPRGTGIAVGFLNLHLFLSPNCTQIGCYPQVVPNALLDLIMALD
jgi:hypothetical protein